MSKFKIEMKPDEPQEKPVVPVPDTPLTKALKAAAGSIDALLTRVGNISSLDFTRPAVIAEMKRRFAETEAKIDAYDETIVEHRRELLPSVWRKEVGFVESLRGHFERYKPLAVYAGIGVTDENLARARKVYKWMEEQLRNWVESSGRAQAFKVFRRYIQNLKTMSPDLDVEYLDRCIEDKRRESKYRRWSGAAPMTTAGLDIDSLSLFGHLLGLSVETLDQLEKENEEFRENKKTR